jgi:hypothetical protein
MKHVKLIEQWSGHNNYSDSFYAMGYSFNRDEFYLIPDLDDVIEVSKHGSKEEAKENIKELYRLFINDIERTMGEENGPTDEAIADQWIMLCIVQVPGNTKRAPMFKFDTEENEPYVVATKDSQVIFNVTLCYNDSFEELVKELKNA